MFKVKRSKTPIREQYNLNVLSHKGGMVVILKFLVLNHLGLLPVSGLAIGSRLDWQRLGDWQLAEDKLIEGIILKAFFSFPTLHNSLQIDYVNS